MPALRPIPTGAGSSLRQASPGPAGIRRAASIHGGTAPAAPIPCRPPAAPADAVRGPVWPAVLPEC